MLAHADPPVGSIGVEYVTLSAGESFAPRPRSDIVVTDKKA
jgi:hypothetical protein